MAPRTTAAPKTIARQATNDAKPKRGEIPPGWSLADRFPEFAAQWHPEKNGNLTPRDVTGNSPIRVWWKCPEGPDHEWEVSVLKRISRQTGCPFCMSRRVSVTNRLDRLFPEIAAEWHPTRNVPLKPHQVVLGSQEKVWWQCLEDPAHVWAASIRNRTIIGTGCPTCSYLPGQRRSRRPPVRPPYEQSLAGRAPDVAAYWHPTKNRDLRPEDVRLWSGREVWWQCPNNPRHKWLRSVSEQARHKKPCYFCAASQARMTRKPARPIAETNPALVREWHPTLNGDKTPWNVKTNSRKLIWWQCTKYPEHEYRSTIRTKLGGAGCRICAEMRPRVASLSKAFPELAAQWHPTLNGWLTPDEVGMASERAIWWKCPKGPDHEWQDRVVKRTKCRHPSACPFCTKRRLSVTNSLAATHPAIAAEWHRGLNGTLRPEAVMSGSRQEVWWQCPAGRNHVYEASIWHRCSQGKGCPTCKRRAERPWRHEALKKARLAKLAKLAGLSG